MPPSDPPIPDIKDIVTPDPLPDYWPLITGVGIVLLFLAGLVIGGIFLYRLLKARQEKTDPQQIALRRLAQLSRNGGKMTPNKFSLEASNTLKDYLCERFGDPLRFETSEEFLARMSEANANSLPMSVRNNLAKFVRTSDEIKFGIPPDAEQKKAPLLAQAREIASFSVSDPGKKQTVKAGRESRL